MRRASHWPVLGLPLWPTRIHVPFRDVSLCADSRSWTCRRFPTSPQPKSIFSISPRPSSFSAPQPFQLPPQPRLPAHHPSHHHLRPNRPRPPSRHRHHGPRILQRRSAPSEPGAQRPDHCASPPPRTDDPAALDDATPPPRAGVPELDAHRHRSVDRRGARVAECVPLRAGDGEAAGHFA